MAAFGARPNAMATSWTDWMLPSVMRVTRKLGPGAMVLGRAMSLMLAEARAVKREGCGCMVGDVWSLIED